MTITFCGHRDYLKYSEIKERFLQCLQPYIEEPCIFLCGGYGAWDHFAAKCCREIKKPEDRLILVLPYQDEVYLKNRELLIKQYDESIYPFERKVPKRLAILERNKWMVDEADIVIAYVEHSWGGASKTLEYAIRKKKTVINLAK